jgi:hypothetical protein
MSDAIDANSPQGLKLLREALKRHHCRTVIDLIDKGVLQPLRHPIDCDCDTCVEFFPEPEGSA